MVFTEILINTIPRITCQGDGKGDIFWFNSKFLSQLPYSRVHFLGEGDNFVDQSED